MIKSFSPEFKTLKILLLLVCPGLAVATYSCDNSLQPLDKDTGAYSIYGGLSLDDSINYIRVKNLNIPLVDDTSQTLNATVSLENLATGRSQQLSDTKVSFDSVVSHNFKTTLPITPRTRYRVSVVRRSDKRTVTATGETPAISDVDLQPARSVTCNTNITIKFDPASPTGRISADVIFKLIDQKLVVRQLIARHQFNFSTGKPLNTDMLNLMSPSYLIGLALNKRLSNPCQKLTSSKFLIIFTHFGPGFFSKTTSDSINVTNGTGRLVGFYKDTISVNVQIPKTPPSN